MSANPHRLFQVAYHDTVVREFHEAFAMPVCYDPRILPSIEARILSMRVLAEEFCELADALGVEVTLNSRQAVASIRATDKAYDPVAAAHEAGDTRYALDSLNLTCGFPGDFVLAEIHRANMTKLGEDGKPVRREDGKIIRGPNYTKPNIQHVLFGTTVKEAK